MIPIFIISLADSPRRKKIIDTFSKAGLKYTFIDAVDARQGVPEKYESHIDRDMIQKRRWYTMTNGEIGCALSHHLIYKKCVTENIAEAIILEDDALIDKEFITFIKNRPYEKLHFDMIMLYHGKAYVHKHPLIHDNMHYYSPKWMPKSTVAYYLNQKSARILLNATTPLSYTADWPIEMTFHVKVGAIYPRIVKHDEQPSTIDTGVKRIYMAKKLLWYQLLYRDCILNYKIYGSPVRYALRNSIRRTSLNISPTENGNATKKRYSVISYMCVVVLATLFFPIWYPIKILKKHKL